MKELNIFLFGMSGAGKDTIANYLRDEYNYLKLRIAGTIKQYVYETYGFSTQEEFETAKRNNPEVRKAHNIFGNVYDQEGIDRSNKQASINRVHDLCNRTALEFEISNDMKNSDICIIDARTVDEVNVLLEYGFYGIVLTRRSDEYKLAEHKTEQGINEDLLRLFQENPNIYIIDNDNTNVVCDIITDGTPEKLLEATDKIISKIIESQKLCNEY